MDRRVDPGILMSKAIEVTTKIAEQGGAAVAVSSWIASYIEWLNHNSPAVLALCGIGGFFVAVLGLFANQYWHWNELKHQIRQKQNRGKR